MLELGYRGMVERDLRGQVSTGMNSGCLNVILTINTQAMGNVAR